MICFHIVHKNVKHLRDEPPIFIPCLLWPNAGMEQDAIWYRGRPWPGHIVLNGDPAPPQKKGAQPPTFGPCPLWPSDWMDKMPLGMEVGLGPGDIVLDGNPAPPPIKWGTAAFHFLAKALWPNGWMVQDATWCGGRLRPWPH